jgi:ketosteroid isomerase-like protein
MIMTAALMVGCNYISDEKDISATVEKFAEAYFNYDFETAMKLTTADSEKWLRYAASNIHQADVDVLRSQEEGASVSIDDITIDDGDTTASALVTVHNYMRLDTIGNAGRMISQAQFRLNMVMESDKWRIKMEGLPRSEKQHHD